MRAGLPREPAELAALALAVLLLLVAGRSPRLGPRAFVVLAAATAAALSGVYVVTYLRGGPRIIDATTYWLEGRALAEGHLAFAVAEPAASTMGRFLVRAGGDGPTAAGIFPPGYPAALAVGFLVHAPLAVGPAIAAAIVVATFGLARRVAPDDDRVARVAASLSVVCAALRYHTSDTMSHGLAALCFTGAFALALAAADAPRPRDARLLAAAAGLLAGWLLATRPPTAAAFAATLAAAGALAPATTRRRALGLVPFAVAGAFPGLALLVAHQHAATGEWLASSQRLYYALADGPPGCFAYGLGPRIGCLNEHGDFVGRNLPNGFGPVEAAWTTLRRLRLHLVDATNAEPLFALVLAGAWIARSDARARLLVVAVVAQIAAYAPFYFDGNYPGGGARLFADVLPFEHVLAALAASALARRALDEPRRARWLATPVALALAGFAFRAGFEHAALRDRDGGRPMFEPSALASAGVSKGVLFLDTDHGFDLAFDPDADAAHEVVALRERGDGLDLLAWAARGRPPAFRYAFDVTTGRASVVPRSLALGPLEPLRIEGESLWPATLQRDAWGAPAFASGTCASAGKVFAVHAAGAEPRVAVEIPRAVAGKALAPRVALSGAARGALTLEIEGRVAARWPVASVSPGVVCTPLPPAETPSEARRIHLVLEPEYMDSIDLFALDLVDIAGSKYIDPDPGKMRDSQGIH